MKIDNRHLAKLTIQELFEKGDKYLIPIYQRNYEWGESHIKQLIDDIKDYFEQEHDKNYYIGTLIVDEREINHTNYFETVDGQQRLTTLNIICCALKAMNNIVCKNIFQSPNISFESRKLADETLSFISQKGLKQPTFENFNENIFEGLKIAYKELDSIKKSMNENFDDFVHYFFTKVILIRVQVPEDTDLNHYFEIMNSRGEQLEKHEVLKSRLMKHLNMHPYPEDARKIFNHIWEACADMNTYVQLLFDKEMRSRIFGKRWFNFLPENATALFEILANKTFNEDSLEIHTSENKEFTIKNTLTFNQIISFNTTQMEKELEKLFEDGVKNESDSKQFQAIVNFENFLLHVLKIQTQDPDVALDDKRLLLFFEKTIDSITGDKEKMRFVMEFAYSLLKARFLLDQYIHKREYLNGEDHWSLKTIKFYPKSEERSQDSYSYVNTFSAENENQELTLLLSMFHVSNPTLVYKNWLYATLNFLYSNYAPKDDNLNADKPDHIDFKLYQEFLMTTAQDFLKYRFLHEREYKYDDIFFHKSSLVENNLEKIEDYLSYNNIRNNLVFNFIDYLLWLKDREKEKPQYQDFEFSFRSSVEHYYPQNPVGGTEKINDARILNCIGNLCLISHNNNSKLSNHLPSAKRDFYIKAKTKDSIKQMEMMNKGDQWFIPQIEEHNEYIITLLKTNLSCTISTP